MYDHIEGCNCSACRHVEKVREARPNYSHLPGCGCENCVTVRDLADAREDGKRAAARAKAFEDGYRRGMKS